jgi:hypothetical protein
MEKTSLKLNMILNHLKGSGVNYKEMPDAGLKQYLKMKYKCSAYLVNQVMKKLAEDDDNSR